jgi:hypothetical protein
VIILGTLDRGMELGQVVTAGSNGDPTKLNFLNLLELVHEPASNVWPENFHRNPVNARRQELPPDAFCNDSSQKQKFRICSFVCNMISYEQGQAILLVYWVWKGRRHPLLIEKIEGDKISHKTRSFPNPAAQELLGSETGGASRRVYSHHSHLFDLLY